MTLSVMNGCINSVHSDQGTLESSEHYRLLKHVGLDLNGQLLLLNIVIRVPSKDVMWEVSDFQIPWKCSCTYKISMHLCVIVCKSGNFACKWDISEMPI